MQLAELQPAVAALRAANAQRADEEAQLRSRLSCTTELMHAAQVRRLLKPCLPGYGPNGDCGTDTAHSRTDKWQ